MKNKIEVAWWVLVIVGLVLSLDMVSGITKSIRGINGSSDKINSLYCTPPMCNLEDQFYMDAPWRVNEGADIPIFGIINIPTSLKNIRIYDAISDSLIDQKTFEPSIYLNESNLPYLIEFSVNQSQLTKVNSRVSISMVFYNNISILGNGEGPLNIYISAEDLPKYGNWYCGDTHYHSEYTNNAVEFGGHIEATDKSARAIGLNWLTVTDHSFDLDPTKWSNLQIDCSGLNTNNFKCLVGEEISCLISGRIPPINAYNHYLAYNLDAVISGAEMEDNIGVTFTCTEITSQVNQNGFGYIAHPMSGHDDPFGDPFRDPWQDYSLNFTGLEIWNGEDNINELEAGLNKWDELLKDGRKIFVEAGSDAHGEFNTGFAKVRTCCNADSLAENDILDSLKNGKCFMTSGPALKFTINGKQIGDTVNIVDGENISMNIEWKSTEEFDKVDKTNTTSQIVFICCLKEEEK